MADRDAHLTDPEFHDIPLERLLSKDHAAELAAAIDPARAARPPAATGRRAAAGRSSSASSTATGNAVSLIESNYMGFGSGVVDPATGIHYQNRGSLLQPRSRPPERARARQADAPHAAARDAVPRRARPWVVTGSMGGDAQPQIHAQVVSALVDGGRRRGDGGRRAALVRRARGAFRPAGRRSAPSRASGPASLDELEAMGHPVAPTEPFDGLLGHCPRDRARRRRAGRGRTARWPPRRTPGAPACPPSW